MKGWGWNGPKMRIKIPAFMEERKRGSGIQREDESADGEWTRVLTPVRGGYSWGIRSPVLCQHKINGREKYSGMVQ
jgi:hypothetical protein